MRIVVDMQGAQSMSRNRGIGRYSRHLAKAIIENRREHEVILLLSGLFPESIEEIRAGFEGLLPQDNIRVWHAPSDVCYFGEGHKWRRDVAEVVREAFITALSPDVLIISSLFEGSVDNTVTSVGAFNRKIPTAVVLYDLIPLIFRDIYLTDPIQEIWYENKLAHLKRADLFLAISEATRQDGIDQLGLEADLTVNISSAIDDVFTPAELSPEEERSLRERYQIDKPYVMYTGGIDHRKNIEGLIRAYANISNSLRAQHQLVVVCDIRDEDESRLYALAQSHGLARHELVFTGFVSDDDLLALYRLCKMFVFPSEYEGFGLPILEAMACGKAVIGTNISSIPEVIGREDLLFELNNEEEITAEITKLLEDDVFREEVAQYGLARSKQFSWKISGMKAIAACEMLHKRQQAPAKETLYLPHHKPKLAYVSPLPPERSGISDYGADILPVLSRYYDIEVIVAQDEVSLAAINANFPVRNEAWLRAHSHEYDRVLYHFGNSSFHQHMFGLLADIPGVVVLHDFYLSGIMDYMEQMDLAPNIWSRSLYESHGYHAVKERFHFRDRVYIIWKYPCNIAVLQDAYGIIVHSEQSYEMAKDWYAPNLIDNWRVVPLLRHAVSSWDRSKVRKNIQLKDDDFVVCSFGRIGASKLNHKLLDAWMQSELAEDEHCVLVFVGEQDERSYGLEFQEKINNNGVGDRVRVTGWVDETIYADYLKASDVGVQLRFQSRGETSAAALDCMNYGLPTIVNANGSMAELPDDTVLMLEDNFSDEDLIGALTTLWKDKSACEKLGQRAAMWVKEMHAPQQCALQYFEKIELFYQQNKISLQALPHTISKIQPNTATQDDILALSESLALSKSPTILVRQLLLDVSGLVWDETGGEHDNIAKTILHQMLINPPDGLRVEPIFLNEDGCYYYAREFTLDFLGCPKGVLKDDILEYKPKDIFLGLSFSPNSVPKAQSLYQGMRRQGVRVSFLVYDMSPLLATGYASNEESKQLKIWLNNIAEADSVICVSESLAREMNGWLPSFSPIHRQRGFEIDWCPLGDNLTHHSIVQEIDTDGETLLKELAACPSFLMLDTLKLGRGYTQTLTAFESLWAEDIALNLIIMPDDIQENSMVEKIQSHPQLGRRLHFIEEISEAHRKSIYQVTSCFLTASEGGGNAALLLEAAHLGLPVVARDIEMFREVADSYAYYFKDIDGQGLANEIKAWLLLFQLGEHPKSEYIQCISYQEASENIVNILLEDKKMPVAKQLFVDVSELIQTDAGTGIQRTVRSLLKALLAMSRRDFRIEPVYGVWEAEGYRYARRFTLDVLGQDVGFVEDEPIVYRAGDVFLGLDFQPNVIRNNRRVYQTLREAGVDVRFVIYDLLSVLQPDFFAEESIESFKQWLEVVAESDGIIAISKSVMNEAKEWMQENNSEMPKNFKLDWFHLGADIESSNPSKGMPDGSMSVLKVLQERMSFLMVGTIEPRKNYEQVLKAFELLWDDGIDANLVFVGKQGWMMEKLVDKLRHHSELGKRLFWLEGISDEYLEHIYNASRCLIMASQGEGFGLPLIEASQHKLPIIARDLPVFKEVAGEHAYYFKGETPIALVKAVKSWLKMHDKKTYPLSDEMPWRTWAQSAQTLLTKILDTPTL